MSNNFILIFIFSFLGGPLLAQHNFEGKILDETTNRYVEGVIIKANNMEKSVSDSGGRFQFIDSNLSVNVTFSRNGYQLFTKNIISGEPNNIVLKLTDSLLSPITVQAYERNTTLNNIPVSVSILSKADLDRYNNTTLVQAVNTVPGVKMDERSPGSYRLSIRGNLLRSPFGVRNVKVYWNGLPFTDANGNTYLNEVGFSNVGKIEIIKGPGGSLYGAGTGGVLLLTGNSAAIKENSLSLNTLAGSWGTAQTDIAYKKGTEKTNFTLSYSHQQSDGWRAQTNMRRDVANYSGTFQINKKQTIATNIFYSDLYYQTPGGLTAAQMAIDPRQSRPAAGPFLSAQTQHASIYEKTFYAGFAHTYHFNYNWTNTTGLYTSSTNFKNPGILNYQRKTEQNIGGRSITQYRKNFLTVNFGGEYQYCRTNSQTYGNKHGVSDTIQFNDKIGATQYNIFMQTDISLAEDLIINAGVSYNNYAYNFTRLNFQPLKTINKTFDPIVVPRISILKKIAKKYSLYATVSKGYSPPTIDEIVPSTGIFNSSLNAENAINYELGFRGEVIKNKLFIDASYYILYLNNTIVTRRDASGADYFVNAGKTKQKGLEATINYYPIRNSNGFVHSLKLWSNYTNINARFTNYKQQNADYSGHKLTGTPPNVFVFGADVIIKKGFYANATYSYTDILPLNDANTFFASQYNLLMGRVGYKKKLSKIIEGEIYMAFDKSFNTPYSLGNDLNASGNRYFNPAAPQNYFGGFKLKFNL